ncbi:hypothetical protein [Hymenobacter sp. CRA2]|uniref:hypothetical protein n=1 Tax=Hymenobacter sp. CRA2 TaxID=1955620 RepID=UPI00098F74F5|nr:hypothetical protein [Hymenobacter sp. CRA2]OON67452.1 hypothetical protein B0919_18500 [Hymenobacter sp. CRA2]
MKNPLKIFLLLTMLAVGSLLTSCVTPGYTVVGPPPPPPAVIVTPRPYYQPRPYYRPRPVRPYYGRGGYYRPVPRPHRVIVVR